MRIISAKKNEPEWMLEYRLNAYKAWLEMKEPNWANVSYEKPNYQDVIYAANNAGITMTFTGIRHYKH